MAVLAGLASLALSALAAAAETPVRVVATFSIIGDFARQVGGDRIDLITLVGPNGDAHVYEPKPADAIAVGAADVVLVNGLQFEGFLQRLVAASGTRATIAELSRGAAVLRNADEGNDAGTDDPHAWQSIGNVLVYVDNIADALCAADAAGCSVYRANADAYGDELRALENEIGTIVARIPAHRRTVITSHDAFGYFARAYGIRFLAPRGISTDAEASAADVAALIRQIRQDGASAIFVENVTNPRLIERIASETGLRIGGELYSDALSDENGPAASYIAMMRHNITTISVAIGSD